MRRLPLELWLSNQWSAHQRHLQAPKTVHGTRHHSQVANCGMPLTANRLPARAAARPSTRIAGRKICRLGQAWSSIPTDKGVLGGGIAPPGHDRTRTSEAPLVNGFGNERSSTKWHEPTPATERTPFRPAKTGPRGITCHNPVWATVRYGLEGVSGAGQDALPPEPGAVCRCQVSRASVLGYGG